MPTKDELTADINSMSMEITEALTKLTNDEAVDLKNIEPRVRVAMDAVGDLAPDDAIEIRPVLVSMLEKMEEFSFSVPRRMSSSPPSKQEYPKASKAPPSTWTARGSMSST